MSKSVYELLIDFDGTTRSHEQSVGLFSTFEGAACKYLELKVLGGIYGSYRIIRRKLNED